MAPAFGETDAKYAALEEALAAAQDRLATAHTTIEDQARQISDLSEIVAADAKSAAAAQQVNTGSSGEQTDVGQTDDTQTDVQVASLTYSLATLEGKTSRLKAANTALRANNKELRKALKKGLPDAELVNAGLESALESLESERLAETAERDALLDIMKPMAKDADHA